MNQANFKKVAWDLLNIIKEKQITVPDDKLSDSRIAEIRLDSSLQKNILHQFAKWGMLKVLDVTKSDSTSEEFIFILEIIQPFFNTAFGIIKNADENITNSKLVKHIEISLKRPFLTTNIFSIDEVLDHEKEKLENITREDDYNLLKTKWLTIKIILDAIYAELPPFKTDNTLVYVDMESLPININIRDSFLSQALQDKILSFRDSKSNLIISSRPLRDYYSGKGIIVKDKNKFEKYRDKILNFFNSIEEKENTFNPPTIKKPNISQVKSKLTKSKIQEQKVKTTNKLSKSLMPNNFKISLRDREIWINDYLIAKPHAVGKNFELFQFVMGEKNNIPIHRKNFPPYLKDELDNKSFTKILNELGFKGEILKAFFYNRNKDQVTFRGDKITKKDLEKAGTKMKIFSKELELAHLKNSPK